MSDFYEDDEPLDEVVAAFEHGHMGVTSQPGIRNIEAPGLMLTRDNLGSEARVRLELQSSRPDLLTQVRTLTTMRGARLAS